MIVTPRGMGSTGSSVVVGVGGAIASASALAGPAAPLVAAIGGVVALAGIVAGALHVGEGCGPTCIQATSIVNQAEPLFRQNVELYQSGQEDQGLALLNFNQLWTAVQQSCGAIPGAAGANCVSDRAAGSCKWKDASGQCWNWDIGYRQPLLVANANNSSVNGNSNNLLGNSVNPMLLVGAGILVLGLMMGSK